MVGLLSAADPWIGVWKMNYNKTRFPGEPPRDVVLTYETHEKGVKLTSRGKLQDGTPYTYYYVAAHDGKDYPVHGHAQYQTVAVTIRPDGKMETHFKRDGRILTKHVSEFSSDAKVMISTSERTNANGETLTTVGYFDRE